MKPNLIITNRSRYDDIEVDLLVRFAFDTVHTVWPIERPLLKIKVTDTVRSWSGYAYINGYGTDAEGFHVCVRIGPPNRFSTPQRISYDHKWRDMPVMFLVNYRECIAYIAAHEFAHCSGRNARKDGEIGTEFAGHDAVEAYRKQQAEIDGRITDRIQSKLKRQSEISQRQQARAAFARSAEGRLQKVERILAYWERRAKIAKTKIGRYRRSASALKRSITRHRDGVMLLDKAATTAPLQ